MSVRRDRPLDLKVGMVRISEARPLENVFERGLRRHSIFTGPESNPLPASRERPRLLDHIRWSCGWMVGCNVGHSWAEERQQAADGARLQPSSEHERGVKANRLDQVAEGGLKGQGMGEGILKDSVPEAHTDYIIAIISEEYGSIISVIIILQKLLKRKVIKVRPS